MNKDCHADIYVIDGEMFLRCLWNGKIINISNNDEIEICPICNRPLELSYYNNPPTRIMKQVFSKIHNCWFDIVQIE